MDCSTAGFPSIHYFQECVQLMSIDSVMPSNHLILCNLLLLPSSISPSIRVFLKWISSLHRVDLCISIGSSTSVSVLPMKIQEWFSLGLTCLISLLSKGLSKVFSCTTVERNRLFGAQLFLLPSSFFFFIFYFILFFYCSGFCHTFKWTSHGFTCVPPSQSPLPPPSPPDPSRSSQCTRSERLSHASSLGCWSVSP